jgi:hypothetical protein
MTNETESLFALSAEELTLDQARRTAWAAGFKSCLNAFELLSERRVVPDQRLSLMRVYELTEVSDWSNLTPQTIEKAKKLRNCTAFKAWLNEQNFLSEGRTR